MRAHVSDAAHSFLLLTRRIGKATSASEQGVLCIFRKSVGNILRGQSPRRRALLRLRLRRGELVLVRIRRREGEAVELRRRDRGIGADIGREDVVADREPRRQKVLVEHVDAVAGRARECRAHPLAAAERMQRVMPMVVHHPRERAVDALVEDVPGMARAVLRADDGGDEVHRRTGQEAARLAVDGGLGEEPHDLAVDGREHRGHIDGEPRGVRHGEAAADVEICERESCGFRLSEKTMNEEERFLIRRDAQRLATDVEADAHGPQSRTFRREEQRQRVLRARAELRIEIDERAAVVHGDAHEHRGARHRLRDLADLAHVVERHAPHAILRRRAQAARVLHGIRVDHAVARDALARERLDLPRRRHVEVRTERRETAQNGRRGIRLHRVVDARVGQMRAEEPVVLLHLRRAHDEKRCLVTAAEFVHFVFTEVKASHNTTLPVDDIESQRGKTADASAASRRRLRST